MIFNYILKNGKLLYPEKTKTASIGIKDGKITLLSSLKGRQAEEFIDAEGCYLLPGLVDAHTHPVYADDLEHIACTAAFGGVTTMIHYLTVKSGQQPLQVCKNAISRGEKTSALDFAFHAALCDAERQAVHIPELIQSGISSFKMFTAYKKLNMMTDDYALAKAMDIIAAHKGMASVHAENGMVIDYLEEKLRASHKNMCSHFLTTSPSLLDREAIFRVLSIAALFGCPLFLPHVSSAKALDALKIARSEGIKVYTETCPHYLVFTWNELQEQCALGKIRPPVKTLEDREALWNALATGIIHTVGSDHAPKTKKITDDFDASPYGAPGVETILPLLWEFGVNKKRITPNKIVELTAENPAKIFGLYPAKGRLENGADADLVLFNPQRKWTISNKNQHSNAGYTLYEGRKCTGKVEKVFSRGRLIVDNDKYLGEPGRGRFLKTHIT
ncbi:MAG: amidohydrolase family protein [Spirochaetales bacterium]|nr:amidohydrolase family protein [Spirochaetales bacterium]